MTTEWIAGWQEVVLWISVGLGLAIVFSWWLPAAWNSRRRCTVAAVTVVTLGVITSEHLLRERSARILTLASTPGAVVAWRGDNLWIQGPSVGGTLASGLLGAPAAVRIPARSETIRLTVRQARALSRHVAPVAAWARRLDFP